MAKRLTKAEKDVLKAQRAKLRAKPFTIDDIAGGDTPQRAYLLSKAPFTIALCSKRAGKSYANMVVLAQTAMAAEGVTALYIGLTEKSVKYTIINKLWNPLVRKYGLPFTPVNADLVATCTTTGSIVRFASSDDQAHIESFMGDTLSGGCVIIDECQSMALNVLQPLVETIIIPSLGDTTEEHPEPGRLILSGTIPETPYGYFYHKWTEDNGWDKHSWNRFENIFLVRQAEALAKVLEALNVTVTNPMVRRLWFGELVFDENDTAYRYVSDRSTYVPAKVDRRDIGPFHCVFAQIPDDCDRFVVGIDPAQRRDRFALVCWGWNSRRRNRLYQVAEAFTDPGANPFESEWLAVVIEMRRLYRANRFIKDPGSSEPVNDTLYHTHGIIIEVALKGPGSLKARVDRLADLLQLGVAKVIADGALDGDLKTAKWSINGLEKGKWEFDKSTCSPDISDAASYAVVAYTEVGGDKPVAQQSEAEYWASERKKYLEHIYKYGVTEKVDRRVSANVWRVRPNVT